MTNRVGQQFGSYRLVRLLGHGGFAEVYLGEHQRLGTQAAVKVLYSHLLDYDTDAFLNEARTIAHLEHPHIIRVFDFDVQVQLSQPTDVVTPPDQAFSPSYVASPSSQSAFQSPSSTSPPPDLQHALPPPLIEPAEVSPYLNTRHETPAPSLKEPVSAPKPRSKAAIIKGCQ